MHAGHLHIVSDAASVQTFIFYWVVFLLSVEEVLSISWTPVLYQTRTLEIVIMVICNKKYLYLTFIQIPGSRS